MRFSLNALETCRLKYGKGLFVGYEPIDMDIPDSYSEEDMITIIKELGRSGIIEATEDDIHLSALAHHIFNMMIEPEIFMDLHNSITSRRAKVYIRNAYYLCVMEDQTVESSNNFDRFSVELLPRLDLVVGSFISTLSYPDIHTADSVQLSTGSTSADISCISWDKERNKLSELLIESYYRNDSVDYRIIKGSEGNREGTVYHSEELSDLINTLTKWMFTQLRITYEGAVK